jgi:PKD repeat protein
VTDDDGATDSASTTATITDVPNVPPAADPNGPYTGTVGLPVTFDGSGSTDPDGTIVSYEWDFGDGSGGAGVSPAHPYAAAGTYTVTLTVTDDDGATDSASTTATITDAPNQPPVADPNGPYAAFVGEAILFDGSASFDPDGTIVSWDWDFGDGAAGAGENPTHAYGAPGTFTVTLTVTDDDGATDSASTTATITEAPVLEPDIQVSPLALSFGDVFIGDAATQSVTVTNVGNDTLTVTGLIVAGSGFGLNSNSPATPFNLTPGQSAPVLVDFAPTAVGPATGTLDISSNDPDEPTVTVDLTGNGLEPPVAVVDLDIVRFQVNKRYRIGSNKPMRAKLVVANNGTAEEPRQATLTVMLDGAVMYTETIFVADAVGDGSSRFNFESFFPTVPGEYTLMVTVDDDDPDDDTAVGITTVVPSKGG